MGKIFQADVPGNLLTVTKAVASIASNGADTTYQPFWVAPADGALVSASYVQFASVASTGTDNYRTVKIVNLGAAGTGTVVMASRGTAPSVAALVPQAMTVQTGSTFSAGDVLAYVTTSTGNGVAITAGDLTIRVTLT